MGKNVDKQVAALLKKKDIAAPSSVGDGNIGPYMTAMKEFAPKYKDLSLLELCLEMKKAQDAIEQLDIRHARAQGAFDLLRTILIPAKMEDEHITNTVFNGIGRVTTQDDLFVSVKSGLKDKFYAWLRKNKLGDLIQGTVNSSTLKAAMKERLKKGKKLPTELLNVTPVTRAVITKV